MRFGTRIDLSGLPGFRQADLPAHSYRAASATRRRADEAQDRGAVICPAF